MRKTISIFFLLFIVFLAGCGRANIDAPTATSVLFQPTREPTAAPNADIQATFVARAVARGDTLFHTNYSEVGFSCSQCHYIDKADTLVGPGLLGLGERAATRVEGQSAEEYIRTSILNPNAHVVDGFPAGVMPQGYADLFNEEELNDLVIYLLGL